VNITTDDSPIQLQWSCDGINPVELGELFRAAGLSGREGEKVLRAFRNSTLACFATADNQLIGAGRALSDREYHATLYDIAVHPSHQRRGIGTRIVTEFLSRLPVWRMLLVADESAQPFYRRLGFQPYGDVMARIDPQKLHGTPSRS